MPRVGFFQSVLRQPTRSYANPHNPSPWALDDDDDNASGSSRGYGYGNGYNDGYTDRRRDDDGYKYASGAMRYVRDDDYAEDQGYNNGRGNGYGHSQAGPSRQSGRYRPPPQAFAHLQEQNRPEQQATGTVRLRTMSEGGVRKPRKAKSTVGISRPPAAEEEYPPPPLSEERLATRFPRAAPKARSVVGIQDSGRNVSVVESPANGAVGLEAQGTVKRKKKKPQEGTVGEMGGLAAPKSAAAQLAADSRARTMSGPAGYTVTTINSSRPKSVLSPSSQAASATKTDRLKARPPSQKPVAIPVATVMPTPPPPVSVRPTAQLVQRPSITRSQAQNMVPPPASATSSSAQSSRDRMPQTPPDPPISVLPVPVAPNSPDGPDLSKEIRPKANMIQRSSSMRTARSRVSVASGKSEGGDTVYWTPPTSPGTEKEEDTSDEEQATEAARAGGTAGPAVEVIAPEPHTGEGGDEGDPETPAADEHGPPTLTIQPPTPAPLADTSESVFNTPVLPSPSPSPRPQATADVNQSAGPSGVPARALSISRPKMVNTGSAPSSFSPGAGAEYVEDDARSLHAHTGSDDEDQIRAGSALSPTPPDSEPMSAAQLCRPPARPPSITHSAPLPPRKERTSGSRSPVGSRLSHSRQSSRAGSAVGSARGGPDGRGSYQPSEISSSALAAGVQRALRPSPSRSREGSIRSSGSAAGFGKGGWAAAAASGSQSGRNSPAPQPVMYMPTGTMDGWDHFHVPPPPRTTKYTPLPTASQPASFERLLHAESVSGSRGGSVRSGSGASSPSPRETGGVASPASPASGFRVASPLGQSRTPSPAGGPLTSVPANGDSLEVPAKIRGGAGRSESSGSRYSDEEEEEGSSSSEEEDGERPSRSYAVVTNTPRGPAALPGSMNLPASVSAPVMLGPAASIPVRRPSNDTGMLPPPIPAKSPRRFSQDEPKISPIPPAAAIIPAPPASESQYSYGSESARESSPLPPSSGKVPSPVQPASPAYTDEAADDVYDEHEQYSDGTYSHDGTQDREVYEVDEDEYEGEDPDGIDMPSRPLSPSESIGSTRFPRPSFLDPDVLTVLPEMSVEDSNNLYRSPTTSEGGMGRRQSWRGYNGNGTSPNGSSHNINNPYEDSSRPGSRAASRAGSIRRSVSAVGDDIRVDSQEQPKEKRPISILMRSMKDGSSHAGSEGGEVVPGLRKAKSSVGINGHGVKGEKKSVHWGEGSSIGEGVLMQSDGREPERLGGYTSLVLPAGAYTPVDPTRKRSSIIDHRILGMPSTSMAALTLSSAASKLHLTPPHLRHNLPPPVDFSSHLSPPNKVGSAQVLVQVYAVGVDKTDLKALEEKGKGEVGRWVPGRSFVGRVISVGKDEREVVKGELVVGLVDVRKSGALAEYMLIDRRRVTRAPHPTSLTLEQLSLLPLLGLPASRTIRSLCLAPRMVGSRALIQDAHQGVPALLCQEFARRGVQVTAIIPGGENAHEAQTKCMAHGARGVLTGSPAAVIFGLEEGGWDYVVDTIGGERVYEACKRVLREGGKLISLVKATPKLPLSAQAASKPSGFRTLRAAFAPKNARRDSKHIHFEYIPPAGDGEPEVDARGMDVRDVLEDDLITMFRPAWEGDKVWNFERGMDAFKMDKGSGVSVIRLIN